VTSPARADQAPFSKDSLALRAVGRVQGYLYILTGAWSLFGPRTFQIVTGFKMDLWIAQTVGAILALVGFVFLLSIRARRITREIATLGGGIAAILGIADVLCVFQPRTTHAYWLDAVAEFIFALTWLFGYRAAHKSPN
jgi:hypothetical protein